MAAQARKSTAPPSNARWQASARLRNSRLRLTRRRNGLSTMKHFRFSHSTLSDLMDHCHGSVLDVEVVRNGKHVVAGKLVDHEFLGPESFLSIGGFVPHGEPVKAWIGRFDDAPIAQLIMSAALRPEVEHRPAGIRGWPILPASR